MSDHRERYANSRRRFFMLCLYVGAYATLRYHGELVEQNFNMPTQFGIHAQQGLGANPNLPYWRQQMYRAVFSLPMVIEEQANRAARKAQGAVHGAEAGFSGPGRGQQQVQYQPPAHPGPAGRPAPGGGGGLAPGEKLIYVAPPNGAPPRR